MTTIDVELQELTGGWVFAGELGFDFRGLTVEQTRRIAPSVVEAAWRRGLGPLLLIHGGESPSPPSCAASGSPATGWRGATGGAPRATL